MKKRLAVVASAAALVALALTGCAAGASSDGDSTSKEESQETPYEHYTFEQKLPDGRKVLCVWAADYKAGGLSCDWESLAKEAR